MKIKLKQLTHHQTNFVRHTFPVILLCYNITDAANIGSMLRTADTFGLEKLIINSTIKNLGRKALKTARSTHKYVNYEFQENPIQIINSLKSKGYRCVGLEITNESKRIDEYQPIQNKVLLIVGSENFGIPAAILKCCDDVLHINMYGRNTSMNVVQATNIALYEIIKKIKSNT